MDIEKRALIEDFPEHKDKIIELKTSNNHFKNLFQEYDELNHKIHNIEQDDIPITDEHMEELKKQRLKLKDELYQIMLQPTV